MSSTALRTDRTADAAPREVFPRRAPWVAAAVLAATLAGIAAYRIVAAPDAGAASAQTTVQRALVFSDRADGGVDVIDAASGRTLDTVHGEQGFLRGALRALVRERRARGLAGTAPLLLVTTADGRLQLADDTTGTRIDLAAFGPDNAGVFARWLQPGARP